MFRYFENLIDPYAPYEETDHPPQKLLPFLWSYCRPFKRVFIWATVMSVVVATVEVGLIWAMGWVVDILSGTPDTVWADHGTALIALAVFILLVRPVIQAVDVLILNNAVLPNMGTIVRWRAHKHVLRQSVGWFENDFAGRIANRVMQTPRSAGEVIYHVFDAFSYIVAYLVGALFLLLNAEMELIIPLLLWMFAYGYLIVFVVKRIQPASQA
ncbi:MAG: ABC transporter transmembrane domain-containing protein, partial [Paracoccaceae bacterium]